MVQNIEMVKRMKIEKARKKDKKQGQEWRTTYQMVRIARKATNTIESRENNTN